MYILLILYVILIINFNIISMCKARSRNRTSSDDDTGSYVTRTGNNGQVQLWQFLLELLTSAEYFDIIRWLDDPRIITLKIIDNKENGISNLKCEIKHVYTLLEGDDVNAILNYSIRIDDAWCRGNNDIVHTKKYISRHEIAIRFIMSNPKNGLYDCGLYAESDVNNYNTNDTELVTCRLKIHLRLKNGPTLSINEEIVESIRQNVPTSYYDYVGYYYFEPGRTVRVQCFRPEEASGRTMTSAYSDVFINTTDEYTSGEINIKLTEVHNNSYLDCIYTTSADRLLLRVYVFVNNQIIPEKDPLVMKVNGERLRSYTNLRVIVPKINYDFYDISYSNDVDIDIKCEKNPNMDGKINLTSSEIYWNISDTFNKDGSVQTSIPINKISDQSVITCYLSGAKSTSVIYELYFVQRRPNNGLYLTGLSNRNILLDYEKSHGSIHVIKYAYQDYDILHLNCFCKTENCETFWIIRDYTTINSSEVTVYLDRSYKNTVLKCSKKNNHHSNDIRSSMIHIILIYENQPNVTRTTTTPYITPSHDHENPHTLIWLIITSALVLLAVLIVCLVCGLWKLKRPQPPPLESLELDTFPNDTQCHQEPEYEEIQDNVPRQHVAAASGLRRLSGFRLKPEKGVLYVHGKRINLRQGHQDEPEYEEISDGSCQRFVNNSRLRHLSGFRLNPDKEVLYVHGKRINLRKLASNPEDNGAPC